MNKYEKAAVSATALLQSGRIGSPTEAWSEAVFEQFPSQKASRAKACPRGAFLGLCKAGLIKGVNPGDYTKSKANKRYALRAVHLLLVEPSLASDRKGLWERVMQGHAHNGMKSQNGQLDVVLALWNQGFITNHQ